MAQLTFDGVVTRAGCFRYRGGLSGEYMVDVESAATVFKFTHGERIRCRKGPHASRGPLVVIGTTGTGDARLLVLHDEAAGHAFVVTNCRDDATLNELHAPEPVPASSAVPRGAVEISGELGYRYTANGDASLLEERYGLGSGSRVHFASLNSVASVAGMFLNVLWVTPDRAQRSVPLVGAGNESALLSLHGMRDADEKTGATSPRTPRTPGRSRPAAAFTVDAARQVASCSGPFGAKLELATDATALQPFGVRHGQKLLATRGLDAGKAHTVVGVKAGGLYVHVEGDKRVTLCRGCENAEQLEAMYGFGLKGVVGKLAPLPGADSPRSPASKTPRSASTNKSADASPQDGPTSPRTTPGAEPRPCWTAHGRVHFDTSAKALAPFGVKHGQLLQATRGGDHGAAFAVFGVRHGTLWVVPDGTSRATALRHCASKADLDKMFGFKVAGTRDLSRLYGLESEPAKTPMNSPRRQLSHSHDHSHATLQQPNFNDSRYSSESPARGISASASPPRDDAAPVPGVNVPRLPLQFMPRGAESSGPAYTVAPDTTPYTIPEVGSSPQEDRGEGTFTPGQMPATRLFLKAYAHFKLGHRNAAADPHAFHAFYTPDPQQRLTAAMASLNTFAPHWKQAEQPKRRVAFANATVDEMLDGMRAAAHILH